MKPIIKHLFSSDVDELEAWNPTSLTDVHFPLDLTIGVNVNDDKGDVFQLVVSTPEALRSDFGTEFYVFGRHYLIVQRYDWQRIVSAIESIVEDCEGETWHEIAGKLSRYFAWEFEDYSDLSATT